MSYLLDTNAWIAYLWQNDQNLVQRFLREDPADLLLCSVVLAELFYGAYHGPPSKLAPNLALIGRLQQRFASLSFNDDVAASIRRGACVSRRMRDANRPE